MEEQERKNEDISLEDILKEFADEPEEEVPTVEEAPAPEETADLGDTVRLDQVTQAVQDQEVTQDTVPFHIEETLRFHLETEDDEVYEEYRPLPPQETVEPFSEEWEPEYEQPMGKYVPMEPIPFRPRSRLHELKKKLVEGPERRYYELSEQGVGKLQIAIFLNLIVAILAAGSTAMHAMGMVPPERLRLLVFFQFLSLLLSALLGSYQLMAGLSDLIRRRFSLDTLLLFSFAACLADGILCLRSVYVPCCAAFSLNMTMSLWSAYQKRTTEMAQMDTMRKATRLDGIVAVPDVYEGRQGFLRNEGQVEDFMDTYRAPSKAEKTLSVYALVALFVSLGTGIMAGVLYGMHFGIAAFSASLLVSVPASSYIAISRPHALLERRLHKHGTVLCGWQGIEKLSRKGVFPLQDTDIFPVGSAKLNGVKFYGDREPDEVVAYAAALICAVGGGMEPLFRQLLESRNGYHYNVDTLRGYPGGGVGGEINGEAVLAGSLSFMQTMGIDMPQGTRVSQAVYVAIDGSLSGVFAITYTKVKSAAMGLTTLCAYRGLTPVMTGGDFMLTESFIRNKFGVNTRRMVFPDRETRQQLNEFEIPEETPALALITREGLAGIAYGVTGARALRNTTLAGVVVHMMGGILGLVMMAVLAAIGAIELVTPANILLYELIWMIPGILITEWTRVV